ncbi:MAG TPA: peptidylprolyl isomerase [Stellaceae bacterium]|nr:peptidylprolyl isomerase [Stellaceae bacterium]
MVSRAMIAALVLSLSVPTAAFAQSHKKEEKKEESAKAAKAAPGEDPVIARVNGTPIYRSDAETLRATLAPQVQQNPPQDLYNRLVDQLIALQLVSQTARKAKVADDPRVKKMIALADEQILQDAYMDSIVRTEITEPKLRAEYDKYVKAAPTHEEVRARHILVPTEAEAKEIIDELNKGADFAKLASEKTTDPAGKASGGDLGYFSQSDMVPAFADAAFALKPGEYTKTPVKTQFGWHVIKVEDRRAGQPESYEKVAPQIARQMAQQIYNEKLKELASVAKIEVFNPDGSKPEPASAPVASAPPMASAPASASAPTGAGPISSGQPTLLPLQNGTPGEPPPVSGPPTMAPGTQDLGK